MKVRISDLAQETQDKPVADVERSTELGTDLVRLERAERLRQEQNHQQELARLRAIQGHD